MEPRQYGNRELVEVRPVQVGGPVQVGVPATGQAGLTAGNQNLGQSLTHDEKAEHFEENDLFYSKERRNYVFWTRNLGYAAIVVAIAALVLASIHVSRHHSRFTIILVTATSLFLIASIAIVYWATRAARNYKSHTDIFQPRSSDTLTKSIFIGGLVLAGLSAFVLTNLYVQDPYSPEYAVATHTNEQSWNAHFGEGTTLDSANNFFRINYIVQSCVAGFFFFFFLLASRSAFRCLKWDNQAMSYLVFLGGTLFLIFGLGLIFYSSVGFDFANYAGVKAHFPLWNIRALFILGIVITVISFVGFLIDHQSWRIGFFVLSFVLLVVLVLLVNFTGYGYRHTRQVYEYYRNAGTCHTNLANVHVDDIQSFGCPAKYIDSSACAPTEQVHQWETGKVAATDPLYCLNGACCGLVGQLYSDKFLSLSNYGLLATIAGTIMSIACYYFWYVSWVDTTRDKRKDFFWLGIMALSIVVFLILFFAVDIPLITEGAAKAALAAF